MWISFKKSFIMNAPLVSCPFPVITFGLLLHLHLKLMTGNGQLTRGAFIMTLHTLRDLNKRDISWLEPSFYALYIHYRNK